MCSVRHGQCPSCSSHVDGFVQSKCLTIFTLKRFLLLGLAQCFLSRAPPSPAPSKWAKRQTPLPQSSDPTAKAEAGWPIAGGDSPAIQTLFKGLGTGPFPQPAETFLFGLDLDWSDTRQPTSRVFFIIGQSACWACEKKRVTTTNPSREEKRTLLGLAVLDHIGRLICDRATTPLTSIGASLLRILRVHLRTTPSTSSFSRTKQLLPHFPAHVFRRCMRCISGFLVQPTLATIVSRH